jgi:hypothetical protein
MNDADYGLMVDLIHSVSVRLNELTEQHAKEIADLQERITRLERNDAARVGATYVTGNEVVR